MKNKTLEKIKSGGHAFGMFCNFNSPEAVEILGLAGFDFVILDMEHGPFTFETVQNLSRAAELRGMTALARTTSGSRTDILRALDTGVSGIVVPQVSTPEEAQEIAKWARYHPEGMRGVALPRSSEFGSKSILEYFKEANRETLVAVQIESRQALENLDGILGCPGIDMAFVGPFDLSQSLGIPGQVEHEEIEKALDEIIAACARHRKYASIFAANADQALKFKQRGFNLIAVGMDTTIFYGASKNLAEALTEDYIDSGQI
ncbi:MAG TPA: aldolase/citrate lyase family protein [Clostridia bacterium]|nr:aldolase/citrate lyase family protein [Clostridia bacterium]